LLLQALILVLAYFPLVSRISFLQPFPAKASPTKRFIRC